MPGDVKLVGYDDEVHGFFNYGKGGNKMFAATVQEMDRFFSQIWKTDSELFSFHLDFLMMHGMVERPLKFSLDELKRFPATTRICFIEYSIGQ